MRRPYINGNGMDKLDGFGELLEQKSMHGFWNSETTYLSNKYKLMLTKNKQ